MPLRPDYKKWLSLGFLKSESVLMAAKNKLSLDDFIPSERTLMAIFKVASDWHTAHNTLVPFEYMQKVGLEELAAKNVLNANEMAEFVDTLEYVYIQSNSPVKQMESYLHDALTEFLEERKVRPILQKAATSSNLEEALNELNVAVQKTKTTKAICIRPFDCDEPITSGDKKVPWGCDFIDAITGGAVTGETTLVLAPSGGGKTLSNIQIACTSALAGEDAVIFSYEQAVVPGLTNRAYAYALGKPVSYFQGMTVEEMRNNMASDRKLRERWEEVRGRLKKKLHMFDMLKTKQEGGADNGAAEIREAVMELQDAGYRPRYVGLDWFGPFIDNYMQSSKFAKRRASAPKHEIMTAAANELRLIGDELKVNIFIYHQLGTAAATKRPMDLPQATDAFESRTLHHYMDTVICIGNRTPSNNLAYVTVPKHRNGEPHHKACIEMDGAHSRWIYRGDKVVDDGNGGLMIPGMSGNLGDDDMSSFGQRNLVTGVQAINTPAALGFLG